jgi:hypothetical protein
MRHKFFSIAAGTLGSVVLFGVGLAGCDSGGQEVRESPESVSASESVSESETRRETGPPSTQVPANKKRRSAPANRNGPPARSVGSHAAPRTLPSGAIVVPPERPRSAMLAPGEGCGKSTLERAGSTVTVTVPPRPGLTAMIASSKVRITYDTGEPPRQCRPDFISVLIDDDGDPHPPRSHRFWLKGLTQDTFAVPVPTYFDSAPDVVRATTGTQDGRLSPTARVLVAR